MNNIKPTLRYALLTVKHKWFVFLAGLKIGVPFWRLITHDLSKFSRAECPPCGCQVFGDKGDPEGFIRAWIHHQNTNDHHWEYWIPRTGHTRCLPPYLDGEPVRMPRAAVEEMIADWFGASRAYEGGWPVNNKWKWLDNSWPKIRKNLHPATELDVISILLSVGIDIPLVVENTE